MKTMTIKIYTDGDIKHSLFDDLHPSFRVENDYVLIWENIDKKDLKMFLNQLNSIIENTKLNPLSYIIKPLLHLKKITPINKDNGNYNLTII